MDTKDDTTLEDELSQLINFSGKMRMLSHRAVMSAQQAVLDPSSRSRAIIIFKEAVDEFRQIKLALQDGEPSLGISSQAAQVINGQPEMADATPTLEQFIALAKQVGEQLTTDQVTTRQLTNLADFVAEVLLSALNTVTTSVSQSLHSLLESRRAVETEVRNVMLAAVESISDVSLKVKLISLNASVEAARAGEHGRGFAVIAQEIRHLSENAAESSHQIAGQLSRLA